MLTVSVFRSLWRRFGLAVLALCAPALFGQTPAVADGFDPNINGVVNGVVVQPNGQILVAGLFSTIWPVGYPGWVTRNNIARLNRDGTVDPTFDPNVNGQISALVLQPDGRILIAGKFTTVQPNGTATATTRNRIARLNADGTLDPTFDPNTGGSLTPQVNALSLQADGKILVGGGFTTLQPNGAAAPTTRNHLARLNADGTLDATFDPNANGMVWAFALQRDGKILVGGGFTALQPNGAAASVTRNRIARLNPDGTIDYSFDPNADNVVAAIAVQADDRIVIGGNFVTLTPNSLGVVTYRNRLAGLNSDGTVDANFAPDVNGNVAMLAIQPDGRLLVGGYFTTMRTNSTTLPVSRGFVGRFNTDGTLDTTFNPNANYVVLAAAFQADGRILLAGNFTTIFPNALNTPTTRNHLARINADSGLDKTFAPDTSGRPVAVALQPDGKLLVAGTFTSIAGVTRQGMARLNADGTLDLTFNPKINGPVRVMLVQADGRIMIGGTFTSIADTARYNLARLNADGTLDTAFNPNPDGQIYSLAQQSDGQIILGGTFSQITRHNNVNLNVAPSTDTDIRYRANIARIKLDGTLDDNFFPTTDGGVAVIKILSDGRILIGGSFSTLTPNGAYSATANSGIARLNADGTLSLGFNPTPDSSVLAIALQADGKIIIGGNFKSVSLYNNELDPKVPTNPYRAPRNHLARINVDGTLDTTYDPNLNGMVLSAVLQSDGKLIIGGNFTTLTPNGAPDWTLRKYFARLNSDGTVDPGFDPFLNETSDNQVNSIALQSDGKMVIVGGFTSMQPIGSSAPTARTHIARITAAGTVDTTFNPSVSGQFSAQINALALQSDGKILAGGQFSGFGGSLSTNLTRFLADSSPDTAFVPSIDGPVNALLTPPAGQGVATQSSGFAWLRSDGHLNPNFVSTITNRITGQVNAIAVQSDGKILVGGGFTTNNSAAGSNFVRFNPDGTLDLGFVPNPDSYVQAIAVQADGKILVGGTFLNIAGVARNYIARLNSDGSADATYDPHPNAQISQILIQPSDGKAIVCGYFDTFLPNGATVVVSRGYVARLKTDGTVDSPFDPGPNFQAVALALQPDGKVLLGGYFTTLKSNGASTAVARNHVARVNADGSLDTVFDPNASSYVTTIAVQPDGKVLLGGLFTTLQPNGAATTTARSGIARVNSDGTLDSSAFDPEVAGGGVNSIALQSDGKIIIGGDFLQLRPNGALFSSTRNHLARLNSDGTVDSGFDPNADGSISVVVLRPDGSVLIGGIFTSLQPSGSIMVGGAFANVDGIVAANLTLLNSDGTINSTFLPNPNGAVYALILKPDGSTLVGGAFTTISGAARTSLARYLTDNTLDPVFAPSVNGTVNALALQSDGRLILGGAFTSVGGAAHSYLARLNADNTVDTSFSPSVNGAVSTILLQSDGKFLLTVKTGAANQLVRLNADGSVDGSFSVTSDGSVNAVGLRTDGLIYVGGTFSAIGGVSVTRLARLTASGAVDATFNPGLDGAVSSLALQSDGKVIAGGGFTTVSGLPRQGLARFSTSVPATDNITVSSDLTTVTLVRGGSSPQLGGVTFEISTDDRVWTNLGQVSRVGTTGNWQCTGLSLPARMYFFVRALEILPATQYASSGLFQVERAFYARPLPSFTSPTAVSATVGSGFYYVSATLQNPTSFAATGLPAGLTIDSSSGIISGTPTQSGAFAVTLQATNDSGTGTATLTLIVAPAGPPPTDARFVNLSTSVFVDSTSPVISGFVISGSEPRSVLLRAVGPGLSSFVSNTVLTNPRLDLFDNRTGSLLLTSVGWGGSTQLSTLFARLGAFPLNKSSTDSAAVVTLPPGLYSIVVSDAGTGSTGGLVLAEVYDASGDPTQGAARLVNLSSRGFINAGNSVLTGGFVITGNTTKTVLIRGIGPALARYGVPGVLSDPIISVFDNQGHFLAQNNDWQTPVTISSTYPAATGAQIAAAATTTGAFPLDSGSKDASVLITLAPGVYSAQVVGATGATGATMVEIYELPAH